MKSYKLLLFIVMLITSCSKNDSEKMDSEYDNQQYKVNLSFIIDSSKIPLQNMDNYEIGISLCSNNKKSEFFMDTSVLKNSNFLYEDIEGKKYAKSGWYSDGSLMIYWSGIHIARSFNCM